MDVKVFQTFLEIAKERHFGRAANNLYITQAAASARIKQLESFYSVSLFNRDRNAIKLTSAGERLLPYAEQIVQTIVQSKSALAITQEQAVQLVLAGTPNSWDAFLHNAFGIISETFAGYAFSVETLSREQIIRSLLERTLDLGVTFDPLKTEEIHSTVIAQPELVLVSSKQQSRLEATAKNYIYVDWGTRYANEHTERHHDIPPPVLRTSNGRIALDFMLQKGGAAYLPRAMVEPFLDSQQLYLLSEDDSWLRPIYLSYRKNSPSLEAIQNLEKLLTQTEPEAAFVIKQAGES
ncbi:LysR family transcriptional regulator [Neiella marina]|uniref:LysR family transcriptional regulator n=1 Tax=Neiella holothuriorum TaxID=2870530 RepID=A0ABS7EBD9_9GAMM|nr:LysR substrate-binding domain-containing protein [Neiella holothuriorum]MBW8189648.1 LysR family transcriptional regulator [Neiella holothuriorum]